MINVDEDIDVKAPRRRAKMPSIRQKSQPQTPVHGTPARSISSAAHGSLVNGELQEDIGDNIMVIRKKVAVKRPRTPSGESESPEALTFSALPRKREKKRKLQSINEDEIRSANSIPTAPAPASVPVAGRRVWSNVANTTGVTGQTPTQQRVRPITLRSSPH